MQKTYLRIAIPSGVTYLYALGFIKKKTRKNSLYLSDISQYIVDTKLCIKLKKLKEYEISLFQVEVMVAAIKVRTFCFRCGRFIAPFLI